MYKQNKMIDRICETCSQPFRTRPDQIKRVNGRYCSHRCYALSRTYDDLATRFWNKIDKSRGDDSCWTWTGYCKSDGYGVIGIRGKTTECTHRVAYTLCVGTIPDGMQILHQCDNPPCCNPAHLFLGTQADNIADMVNKGRTVHTKGESHPLAKLTVSQVEEIRTQFTGARGEKVAFARKFNVSPCTIRDILNGSHWK